MTDSNNEYEEYSWIPSFIRFCISFLLIFVIVSFMSDTNIGVILGFIGALFVSLFILWVERKLKKSDKKKEDKEIYKLLLLDKLK